MASLCIIVPTLNEAPTIATFLTQLKSQLADGSDKCHLFVVDGGSDDATCDIVLKFDVVLLNGPRGRAQQMNYAAAKSSADYLLFLHCDTQLPDNFVNHFSQLAEASAPWGFFQLRLSGARWPFRIIEKAITWRSSLSAIASGDQAIFVKRSAWLEVKGYRDLELMEDIDLCKRLRQRAKPYIVPGSVLTSSRRWENRGVIKTVFLMWGLRLAYYFGVSDKTLARWYR